MLTQFRQAIRSLPREGESADERHNRMLEEVNNILTIVGFTRQEGFDFIDNLHIFNLDQLAMVTTEVINGQLVELGITEC